MSFQLTVLTVLAGHPDGRATVIELTRFVSVLVSSGSDWTNRMRRLAARAPALDIFTNSFVLRDENGWQITDRGRQFLDTLREPVTAIQDREQSELDVEVPLALRAGQSVLRLVVDNTRISQSDRGPDETRRSA